MARQTIKQIIIANRTANGLQYLGATSGWRSTSKTSNCGQFLSRLGLLCGDGYIDPAATIETGARLRYHSQGCELLIFVNPASPGLAYRRAYRMLNYWATRQHMTPAPWNAKNLEAFKRHNRSNAYVRKHAERIVRDLGV